MLLIAQHLDVEVDPFSALLGEPGGMNTISCLRSPDSPSRRTFNGMVINSLLVGHLARW